MITSNPSFLRLSTLTAPEVVGFLSFQPLKKKFALCENNWLWKSLWSARGMALSDFFLRKNKQINKLRTDHTNKVKLLQKRIPHFI